MMRDTAIKEVVQLSLYMMYKYKIMFHNPTTTPP